MINVEGLTHYYGERRAIEGLDFTISTNEIVGFLGLNGAGKSTTLKILAGLLVPTAGSVAIDGVDMVSASAAFRSRIGYLPEDPPLYREMTVTEYLRFCGRLKGMKGADVDTRLAPVLAVTQLTHVQNRVIGELSHGYKKRVGIAQAIIHAPQLVILDEPISGLDPRQIVEMRQVIRDLGKQCTVLLSSHILGEISETCDRVLVLAGGRIAAQGSEEQLRQRPGGHSTRITMTLRGPRAAIEAVLSTHNTVAVREIIGEGDDIWHVNASLTQDDREGLIASLVASSIGVRRLVEDEGELEKVFLGLTQGATA